MQTEQRIKEAINALLEALVADDECFSLTAEEGCKEPVLDDADQFRTAIQVLRWVLEEDIRQDKETF